LTPKVPFVIVHWLDAWKDAVGDVTLDNAKDNHRPIECFSHGWVVQDDEQGIQLANEYSPNGTFRHTAFIPRKMIQSVTPYNLSRPRAKRLSAIQRGTGDDPVPDHGPGE
jgi:hypothetical protein